MAQRDSPTTPRGLATPQANIVLPGEGRVIEVGPLRMTVKESGSGRGAPWLSLNFPRRARSRLRNEKCQGC